MFLSTGKTFGTEVPGWFRIAFAHEEAYLLEGLERVVRGNTGLWQADRGAAGEVGSRRPGSGNN